MLSTEIVQEVSRTSQPAMVSNWRLTVDDLVKRTMGTDWESGYYVMKSAAAARVAQELNAEQPWRASAPPRTRRAKRTSNGKVIEGSVVATRAIGAAPTKPA